MPGMSCTIGDTPVCMRIKSVLMVVEFKMTHTRLLLRLIRVSVPYTITCMLTKST